MIIELRGRHNEMLVRIDTRDYKHCEGIFIEVSLADERREHTPVKAAGPPWHPQRKIANLPAQPAEVS